MQSDKLKVLLFKCPIAWLMAIVPLSQDRWIICNKGKTLREMRGQRSCCFLCTVTLQQCFSEALCCMKDHMSPCWATVRLVAKCTPYTDMSLSYSVSKFKVVTSQYIFMRSTFMRRSITDLLLFLNCRLPCRRHPICPSELVADMTSQNCCTEQKSKPFSVSFT